jgi:hypothetical protein
MGYDATSLAVVLGVILAAGGLGAWLTAGAERRLRRWADGLGLTVLSKRRARIARGPFTWTSTRTDFVYRVTVRDRGGDVREGWVRVPGVAVGTRRRVEARWDGMPPSAATPFD